MPISAPYIESIQNAQSSDKIFPPMKNTPHGQVSKHSYRLRVTDESWVVPDPAFDENGEKKYPYWRLILKFDNDEDIEKYGPWQFNDYYSVSPKADFKKAHMRHLCEHLNIPYDGSGIVGKKVNALLTVESYKDENDKVHETLKVLKLHEWTDPKKNKKSSQQTDTPPEQQKVVSNDEIPF